MSRWIRGRGRHQLFRDRIDAGEQLAARLVGIVDSSTLVLGLPRGGVPIAAEVARALNAELDVLVARKVGAPRQPELAVGAVTADGGLYLDTRLIEQLRISSEALEERISRERQVAVERDHRFRGGRPYPRLDRRTVVLVDDGLATGATMLAAVHAVRKRKPYRLIVAAPVGSRSAVDALGQEADEVVCLHTLDPFHAVGLHYEDFRPTSDAEVEGLLRQMRGYDSQ